MTKILADCCCNHLGDRRIMQSMIETASRVDVDIIKFQSFKADKLRKDWPDYEKSYRYYKKHELSESDHYFLMDKCKENGIEFLTTVFDLETVDFLADDLGLKQVKIASPDANNWDLIDRCIEKFDKVFMSTGMHTQEEINDLINYVYFKDVVILHCISEYPTKLSSVNMNQISQYKGPVSKNGFSDHTIGLDASKLAISLGVDYVERHFTLSRYLPGNDHHISSTPDEFKELCEWRDKVDVMMGSSTHDLSPEELDNRNKYVGRWSG